jgi:3-hydroxyisobutyrate dehydrogenase-like beta-hydroxyacid dehydrogenase
MKMLFMEQALSAHLKVAKAPRIVFENEEVEKSQVILAAQDMIDSVQKMYEDVNDMLVKELPALVDSIQSEIGANESDAFNQSAGEALTQLNAALQQAQMALKGSLSGLTGGGEADAYAVAEPVIASYAKMCKLIGGSGAGQLTKMVNQICIAGVVQGLAEALNFGQRAGLDMEAVLAVISKGAAQSWQMEKRGKTMLQGKFDFGFAADWMRKDLRITMEEARRNGAQLPVTTLIDQFYAEVQAQGHGRWDTSSLMSLLTKT